MIDPLLFLILDNEGSFGVWVVCVGGVGGVGCVFVFVVDR